MLKWTRRRQKDTVIGNDESCPNLKNNSTKISTHETNGFPQFLDVPLIHIFTEQSNSLTTMDNEHFYEEPTESWGHNSSLHGSIRSGKSQNSDGSRTRESFPEKHPISSTGDNPVAILSSTLPDVARTVPSTRREILGPAVQWERENLNLEEFASADKFPCVGFFEEDPQELEGHRYFLSAGLSIYSLQPVLFYMKTRQRQARARTIHKDSKGAYYEIGQTLIIPEDYQGWFELVPSDFSRAKCFLSIQEVAKVMPRRFFTRSNIRGVCLLEEGDQQKILEKKVVAGSVLQTKGTFTAKWKTRAETGLLKKKTKEWVMEEVTYLKCVDQDQQDILIPLTHKGKFNAIYEKGRLNQNAVYSMKDLLSDLPLPVRVRLLFGKAPVVPCIFTGMLVIRSTQTEEVLVGSTTINTRNVLFDLPLTSPVKVKYTLQDHQFADSASYKDAQKLCKKYAALFSTMIKLSPDLDTDQKVIMHVPSANELQTEDSLRVLDLITDISFTDEPRSHLLDPSDSGSRSSDETSTIPKGATMVNLQEFRSQESQTHV